MPEKLLHPFDLFALIVYWFVLNTYSLVLGNALIMAIVSADTLIALAKLPSTGLLILIIHDFSSISIHFNFNASAVLAPVSFST